MSSSYRANRAHSDRYIPAMAQIIGPLILEVAPVDRDVYQASDLTIFKPKHKTSHDLTIAARTRRPGYAIKGDWAWDITMRNSAPDYAQTEFQKFVSGYCDYFFYGHGRDTESLEIFPWFLVDMCAFRAHLINDDARWTDRSQPSNQIVSGCEVNGDESSFRWFDVRTIIGPPSIILASSPKVPVVSCEELKAIRERRRRWGISSSLTLQKQSGNALDDRRLDELPF